MQVQEQVIYLAGCAVNEKIPELRKISDFDGVYKFANAHMLTSIIAFALESAGLKNNLFTQARGQALRKLTLLEIDSEKVFAALESSGIWYMPLKGSVLKNFYPAFGMREMSDVDILFEPSRSVEVKNIMLELGFTVQEFGIGNHDVYYKQPVSIFEMHRALFIRLQDEKIYNYYSSIKEKLIRDNENNYAYHFRPEDLYLYMTAHEFKHYSEGGTGLRSLLDVYVFMKKFAGKLDFDYVNIELEKLGISSFEANNRTLALNLFSRHDDNNQIFTLNNELLDENHRRLALNHELTDENKEMLSYIINSGTYGNIANAVKNELEKNNGIRLKYIFRKVFPPMNKIEALYPSAYKHKILIPFVIIYRLLTAMTVKRKKVLSEIKALLGIS